MFENVQWMDVVTQAVFVGWCSIIRLTNKKNAGFDMPTAVVRSCNYSVRISDEV